MKKTIFVLLFFLLCISIKSEAGLSKIKELYNLVENQTTIPDKKIEKEVYSLLKSNLPAVSIVDKDSRFVIHTRAFGHTGSDPCIFNLKISIFSYHDDDIGYCKKVYWKKSLMGWSSINDYKKSFFNTLKDIIKEFAHDWYRDKETEQKGEKSKRKDILGILEKDSTEHKKETTKDNSNLKTVFVGSVNSNSYHYPWCTHAKKISQENIISFSSTKKAQDKGYVPCKVCRPPW